jgi:hypothetical protein
MCRYDESIIYRKHPVARVIDTNDDFEALLKEEPQIEYVNSKLESPSSILHTLIYVLKQISSQSKLLWFEFYSYILIGEGSINLGWWCIFFYQPSSLLILFSISMFPKTFECDIVICNFCVAYYLCSIISSKWWWFELHVVLLFTSAVLNKATWI